MMCHLVDSLASWAVFSVDDCKRAILHSLDALVFPQSNQAENTRHVLDPARL